MQSGRAEQRRSQILELARRDGHVVVSDLAGRLDVATETVRRDLRVLTDSGQLRRTHGNAFPIPVTSERYDDDGSDTRWSIEKFRIARAAVQHLGTTRTLFLDSSDTHQLIASQLANTASQSMTVLTPSLTCAAILSRVTTIEVILLGGRLRTVELDTSDHWVVSMLNQFHVDLAIMGADGFSASTGATVTSSRTAAISNSAMAISARRFFVGDHSKFDNMKGAYRFAAMKEFDLVVSDLELPNEEVNRISAHGPRVIRV